jgi:hypothetical protein
VSNGVTNGVSNTAPSRPVPTRPDPKENPDPSRDRASAHEGSTLGETTAQGSRAKGEGLLGPGEGQTAAGVADKPSNAPEGPSSLVLTNTLRAYARFSTDGAGGVTVVDGVNIASATVDALDIIVTFAHAFANANYAATTSATSIGVIANPHSQTTTTMKIRQYDASLSATVNPSTDVGFVALTIGGRQ